MTKDSFDYATQLENISAVMLEGRSVLKLALHDLESLSFNRDEIAHSVHVDIDALYVALRVYDDAEKMLTEAAKMFYEKKVCLIALDD